MCIYIYIYVCVYINIHIYIYVYIYNTKMHVCSKYPVHMCIHIHATFACAEVYVMKRAMDRVHAQRKRQQGAP